MLDTAPPMVDINPMPRRSPHKMSDQLRDAIVNAEQTRYAISKATGIDQAVLTKFVSGERGLSMPTIDLLVEYLQLELRPKAEG